MAYTDTYMSRAWWLLGNVLSFSLALLPHPPWQSKLIYVAPDGSYMRNPEMCHFTTLLMHLHKQLNLLYTPSHLCSVSFLSGNDLDMCLIFLQPSVCDTTHITYIHWMTFWICHFRGMSIM